MVSARLPSLFLLPPIHASIDKIDLENIWGEWMLNLINHPLTPDIFQVDFIYRNMIGRKLSRGKQAGPDNNIHARNAEAH